jgi:L-alanine-DL-glutamate epimerase-like enolase superfamily enzyme
VEVEAWVCEVPLREPLRIAPGTYHAGRSIIIRLRDGDLEGWGEACQSQRVLGETFEDAVYSLKRNLRVIQKATYDSIEMIHEFTEGIDATPSIKAALNIALLDLYAKSEGRPLWRVLGGYRDSLVTDITIGIMEPGEMAKRALSYAEKGFTIFKLKLGEDPQRDVERVRAVRDALGEGVTIRVDANEGWRLEEAIRVINRIADYNVELVEQPLRHDAVQELKTLRKESPLPIALDESVRTPGEALRAVEEEIADIINIKLMKSRGITPAVRIIAISESAGVKNMVGCFSETRLGITATAYLAQAFRNVAYYDLDCDILSLDPVFAGGSEPVGGVRRPSQQSGLGVALKSRNYLKPLDL